MSLQSCSKYPRVCVHLCMYARARAGVHVFCTAFVANYTVCILHTEPDFAMFLHTRERMDVFLPFFFVVKASRQTDPPDRAAFSSLRGLRAVQRFFEPTTII